MNAPLDVECRGRVAVVTLNRPERRNALSLEFARAVREPSRSAERDVLPREVVPAGALMLRDALLGGDS